MTTVYSYDPLFLEHDLPGHPENRTRLEAVMHALGAEGLLDRMTLVPGRPVEPELLAQVHDSAHIAAVKRIASRGGGFLDPDTYLGPASYDAALMAAGAAVELVAAVLSRRAHNGIGLLRPPGHHATRSRGMGFCLFNNVAVAAQAALATVDRVLIVDWDVHHGNGTQDIFYHSPRVLFFSTHQYPHYPGTGHWREVGSGAGQGYTVNVPFPAGVGDAGFQRIYAEVLTPLARRFRPDLILVSAGYDAHWSDPLAGLRLSLAGYWELARTVVALATDLCEGRLVVVLEGGYDLDVLTAGVANTCRALLGDPAPGADPLGPSAWPERGVEDILEAVKKVHGLA